MSLLHPDPEAYDRKLEAEAHARRIRKLKEDAVARYGSKLGGLLAQGLEEGIISPSKYVTLTPPLHRRIIYAFKVWRHPQGGIS
ncbi:hypothetical protein LESZY_00720 [Brevundimonas phage vB_BpoS-Leszy]|nr:hypothetical protein LESZY_00720 [Brevundimonas phage vB_BpoS-Leszy]